MEIPKNLMRICSSAAHLDKISADLPGINSCDKDSRCAQQVCIVPVFVYHSTEKLCVSFISKKTAWLGHKLVTSSDNLLANSAEPAELAYSAVQSIASFRNCK